MKIKNILVYFLKVKQRKIIERYHALENFPEHDFTREMDDLDWACELIRRKIDKLEGT